MLLVPCSLCGPRNVDEFRYYGVPKARPAVESAQPGEWRSYLYMKRNPAEWTYEWWYHTLGCRTFFLAERETLTNEFRRPVSSATSEEGTET